MHKILYGNCHIGLQWFVRKRCIHVMMYLWLKTRNTMYTRSPLWFESLPFSQILGGIGGPKKIIWDSRKNTERSEGKICRVWTTCWAPVICHGRPWWSCRCCGRTSKSLKSQWWIWVGHVPWRLWLTVCFWHLWLSWFPGGNWNNQWWKRCPGFNAYTIRKTSCRITRFLTRSLRFVRQPPSEP